MTKKEAAIENEKTEEKPDKVEEKQTENSSTIFKIKKYLSECEIYNILSVVVVIVATLCLSVISFDEYIKHLSKKAAPSTNNQNSCKFYPLKYWAYGRNIESGYLHNVFMILDRLGYENAPNTTEWDLLWAHDYPFRTLYTHLNNLKPHQRVNHFPGCGYLTNKVDLATSGLKYIPPAFKLPVHKEKLLEYAKKNPDIKFVQKNNEHRHIKIQKLNEIDLNIEGTFIQEFVDKPYLISGHKFDIGVYTIISSIDPLRIYIYNGDILFRFCPEKYYPFDPEILDKYVVGDDYLPTWEVPDLSYYYNELKLGMRESFNAYARSKGQNPKIVWDQVEDAIRAVVLAKEPQIIEVLQRFKSKRNFFEMMRFDFVIDENLKVYLMEANMSPNLSSAHFPPNQLLFEQVIFNLMSLVGLGERVRKNSLVIRETEDRMIVSDKNLAVFPKECSSPLCRSSCISPECQLCRPCLSKETRDSLTRAFKEHINRQDCKRIFPPQMTKEMASLPLDLEKYSPENSLQYKWFQGKCLLDDTWCG